MRAFINENAKKQKKTEQKRAIIGPGQAKKGPTPKSNDDILGLDLFGTSNQHGANISSQQKISHAGLTFDQLMGNSVSTKKSTNLMYNDLI